MKRALLIALACCHADHGPRDHVLRISSQDSVRSLDPAIEYDEVSTQVAHMLYATLVDYAPASTQLVPGLAERWDVSPDGLTYTFHLRAELAYSDGAPVAARDFQFALARVQKLPDSPFGAFLSDVASITAPDDRTLVIVLAHANGSFLNVLAMPFATPQRPGSPLGTGPFLLASWDEGQKIVLAKNLHYWNAAAIRLDGIEMLENIPRDTQFLMFERGEIDTAERLAAPDYLWVTSQPQWKPYVHTVAQMSTFGARMNVTKKPFDDRRVRQALNYALDKAHTVKLLQGAAVPAHGILPPGVLGRDDTLAPYPHDPGKARALLADAGYPDGFDVEYLIMNDSEAERVAASLQADLAEVGVRVHLSELAFATYAAALASKDGPAFATAGWIADFPDPVSFFDASFHSRAIADDNGTNYAFYANPELDALLDAARTESDPGKRADMYKRAEHIVYDDAPWLWNYHRMSTEVTQPYVKDYEPHPVWGRDYSRVWLAR